MLRSFGLNLVPFGARKETDGHAGVAARGLLIARMNRYQQELAEFDRRRHWRVRAGSLIGTAVLVVAVLWSAGVPPTQWWSRIQNRLGTGSELASRPVSAPAKQTLQETAAPSSTTLPGTALPGTDSSTSPTAQSLFLMATAPGRNENEGTAQIGTNPDNPQTYVAGALLANGARLTEIHREYVLLERGSSSAKLELFRRDKPAAPSGNALLRIGAETQAQAMVAPKREILTEYLRPSPVYDGDVLRGYQVYPGAKAGVFSRLGLQAGDVITAINDMPLSEPHQAMELFGELTRGTAVTAIIERKNTIERVALDGAIIVADRDTASNAATGVAMPGSSPST